MKFFVPLRTQSSPSRIAVVRSPEASEPEAGSVRPHAPILLGEDGAEHAELAEFLDGGERKRLRFVPLHHVRLDLAFRELTDHVADLFLIVGQAEIHARNLP